MHPGQCWLWLWEDSLIIFPSQIYYRKEFQVLPGGGWFSKGEISWWKVYVTGVHWESGVSWSVVWLYFGSAWVKVKCFFMWRKWALLWPLLWKAEIVAGMGQRLSPLWAHRVSSSFPLGPLPGLTVLTLYHDTTLPILVSSLYIVFSHYWEAPIKPTNLLLITSHGAFWIYSLNYEVTTVY